MNSDFSTTFGLVFSFQDEQFFNPNSDSDQAMWGAGVRVCGGEMMWMGWGATQEEASEMAETNIMLDALAQTDDDEYTVEMAIKPCDYPLHLKKNGRLLTIFPTREDLNNTLRGWLND